jgi:hypothetical protein
VKAWAIGNFFGCIWAMLGVLAFAAGWRLEVGGTLALVGAALIAWGSRGQKRAGSRADAMFRRQAYVVAVILEVAAIVAASAVLPRLGLKPYLMNAVGVIVGLHFLGLWKASGATRFVWIAAAMVTASLASILLPQQSAVANASAALLGIGNAMVLWIGANLFPFKTR